MGKGSGTSTNTTVTQSDPPKYVADAYKALLKRATTVSNTPYESYAGETVAGLTPDQLAAFQTIQDAKTIQDPYYSAANDAIGRSTSDVMAGTQDYNAENIQQYYNPYQQAVIDATMANINETNAQQQTSLQGDAISAGAWGGDRSGVAAAELARQQGLASNQTLADLSASGFTNAQSMLQSQNAQKIAANESQNSLYGNAATAYGNLGTSAQTAALQGASTQLQSGALQQQQEQNQLNADYQAWLAEQSYPFETTQFLASNVFGLPSTGTSTSTATSPAASAVSQIGGLGVSGLSLYGAMSGSKDGGRIGYSRGGVAVPHGNDNHYLYGGATPYTRGLPNQATGYVPAVQNIRAPSGGMMQPSGSTAKSSGQKEKSLGEQAEGAMKTGLSAKNAIKGGQKIYDKVSGLFDKGTSDAAQAVWNAGAQNGSSFTDALNAAKAADSASLPAGFTPTASGIGALPEAGTTFTGAELAGQQAATQGLLGAADVAATDAAVSGLAESALASTATEAGAAAALDAGVATAGSAMTEAAIAAAAEAAAAEAAAAAMATESASLALLLLKKGGRVSKKKTKGKKKLALGGDVEDDEARPWSSDGELEENEAVGQEPVYSPVAAPSTGLAAKKREVDPWQTGLVVGLNMMAGESPNALTNIGRAGIAGVQDYSEQKSDIEKANYRDITAQQAANKLMQEAEWRKRQGDIQSEKNDIARTNALSAQDYRNKSLSIRQQEAQNNAEKGDYDLLQWSLKDKDGNPIEGRSSYNRKTGQWLNDQAPPAGATIAPVGKDGSTGKGSGDSVFDTKFAMAMKITGGDEKSAFDMASGIKKMSDAEIRKYASDYADERMKSDMSNLGKDADVVRKRLIQEQMDFIKNGFPKEQQPKAQGGKQAGTRDNPLVPSTQSDIDNAPKGTVFKINGKLMVK